MKTYKTNLPEITLKLKKGEALKAKIGNSNDAADIFRQVWDKDSLDIYESVIIIFLNRHNNTIGWYKASQGGLSGTIIDNRLILVTALNCLASGIIICHNHPSGNLQPSEADIKVTQKLKDATSLLDIRLLDHIILTEESYLSMADEGVI
jgi:DNA repair protein RadC